MINHVRTLLLNRSPDALPHGGQAGDEIVPTDFRPLTSQPAWLSGVRRILFGASPDRLMGNYRVRQLLGLLRAADLEDHVRRTDPRITYDLRVDPLADDSLFVARSELASSLFPGAVPGHDPVAFFGAPPSPDATGRTSLLWSLDADVDAGEVVVRRLTPPAAVTTQALDWPDGVGEPIRLTGTEVSLRLPVPSSGIGRFTVRMTLRPSLGPVELAAALRGVGARHLTGLFGVGSAAADEEPLRTYRALWEDHPELCCSLGGLVLAVAHRTWELLNA